MRAFGVRRGDQRLCLLLALLIPTGGSFLFPFLVPGRYVIELVSDGAVLTQMSVETAPGEEPFVTLVAPSP